MKDIDFLPADYREKSARRRGGAWRLVAALAFLVLIGGVDIRSRMIHSTTHQQLAELQQPYLAAQQTRTQLATVENELTQAKEYAGLMAFLEHRWPVSQLLAIPTITTPTTIRLEQVRLERRSGDDQSPASNPTGGDFQLPTTDAATASPTATALAELRRLSGTETLTLSGTTTDTQAVQQYVNNLTRSPLVKTANLKTMTKAGADKIGETQSKESQFQVQVTIVDSLKTIGHSHDTTLQRTARANDTGERNHE